MRKSRSRRDGIDVTYERRRGAIVGITVRGHAGFASAGEDIVCAAASVLVQSAAYGLDKHCAARPRISDAASQFRIELPAGAGSEAQAVLETTVSGLEAIAQAYPRHIRVRQAKHGTNRKSRV